MTGRAQLLLLSATMLGMVVKTGCASGDTESRLLHRSISVDGDERSFDLYVPAAAMRAEGAGLVISFHGYRQTAADQRALDRFDELADSAGYLVAWPEGLTVENPRDSSGSGWNIDGSSGPHDDIAFATAMINGIIDEFTVDPANVHATGFSMGARMAFELACVLPDRVSSVSGVASAMDRRAITSCTPGRPLPAMLIYGSEDPAFPEEGVTVGRFNFAGPLATSTFWARNNRCDPDPSGKIQADHDPWDGTTVTRFTYLNCAPNGDVVRYRVNRGGHSWPGGPDLGADYGRWNRDVDASRVILAFFAGQTDAASGPP